METPRGLRWEQPKKPLHVNIDWSDNLYDLYEVVISINVVP